MVWQAVIRWLALGLAMLAWGMGSPVWAAADATVPAPPWQRLDDLRHGRIGFIMGTVHGAYAERAYPQARRLTFNGNTDLVAALQAGKLDAALFDAVSARPILQAHPELGVLEEGFLTYPMGMGFRRDRADLRARFDDFLTRIRADGRYDAMHRRWFEGDPEAAVMPDHRPRTVRERVVVGVSVADLPFVAYKDGRYVGFDVEMLQRFAAEEDIALEIRSLDFGALIPALAAGKVDIISDGIAITEERKKAVDFSAPYTEGRAVALALRTHLAAPARASGRRGVDDLAQARIGVFIGTAQDIHLSQRFPQADILRYNSQADFVLALKTGKADAIASDAITLRAIARDNPEFAILDEGFYNTPIAAAFRKGEAGLRQRFDAFLAAAKADGTLAAMQRRWMVDRPETAVMPDIPLPEQGPLLRVGTSVLVGLPFVSQADGRFIGYDMELARRFAAREGLRLEIVPMEFDALIAALAVGKVDALISSLSVTDERRLKVDFSSPYVFEHSAVLVLKNRLAAAAPAAAASGTTPRPGGWLEALNASLQANFVVEQRWKLILDGLWITVLISVFATLFGTALGATVCGMRMSSNPLLRQPARLYIVLLRGLPVLVLLMLIFYVVFASVDIDPVVVAVIAFGLNFAAYVSEMFRTGIESVDRGQQEAGIAMGFSRWQSFVYIVLPQAVRRILPVYKGEFISLVKMTSIVGYIGVQDLTKASDIIRSRTFEAFFPLLMVAAIYFLIIWVLGLVLDYIDRRTDPTQRKGKGV